LRELLLNLLNMLWERGVSIESGGGELRRLSHVRNRPGD